MQASSSPRSTYTAFQAIPAERRKFDEPPKAPASSRRVVPLPTANADTARQERHRTIVKAVAGHFGGEKYLREAVSCIQPAVKERVVAFMDLQPAQLRSESAAALNAGLDLLGQATEAAIQAAEEIHDAAELRQAENGQRLTRTQARAVAYCLVRQATCKAATADPGVHAKVLATVYRSIDAYASIPMAKLHQRVNDEVARLARQKTQDSKSSELSASDFATVASAAGADDDAPVRLKARPLNPGARPQ